MIGRKPKVVDQKLEDAIERVLDEMLEVGPDAPEYPPLIDQLEKLQALRRSNDKRPRLDPNALISAGGSILGILVIVAYEQKHVFTSKGLNFVPKAK